MNTDLSQMTPDEAKASLGMATALQDQLLTLHGNTQSSETPEMPVEQDQNQEQPTDTITPRIDELENKFVEFEKEIKKSIKNEINGIKTMVEQAINEDIDAKK